jgi:hypothetical protein
MNAKSLTARLEGRVYFTSGAGTRKSRNLAADPRCAASCSLPGLDLVIEGMVAKVTDAPTPTLARLAARCAANGWPAAVSDGAISAPYSAPSAGPAPWDLYVVNAADGLRRGYRRAVRGHALAVRLSLRGHRRQS